MISEDRRVFAGEAAPAAPFAAANGRAAMLACSDKGHAVPFDSFANRAMPIEEAQKSGKGHARLLLPESRFKEREEHRLRNMLQVRNKGRIPLFCQENRRSGMHSQNLREM
ncbi:MAG: hypothetical protein ACK4UL_04250 [Novosphingobium meiothermophilum]|uniref:hypothetical protein n=1 Tax=Novosphingobium TaxID=165696 RepID=UPI0011AB7FBD|nr:MULTISPECIES: hypothetical protein [Novosphingobium]